MFNQVAVRVASQREGALVDYLSDTDEAWLLVKPAFSREVSTPSESFGQRVSV